MARYLKKMQKKLNVRITARNAAVATMPNGRGWTGGKWSAIHDKAYRKPGKLKKN